MLSAGVVMRLGKVDFVELIKTPTLQALTYKEALALIEQGGQWLDVRFPDEYRAGAIAGSVNIPLQSLRLESAQLDAAKRYVLYCDTTKRSSTGAFLLAKRGFEVAYLAGGLRNNPKASKAMRPVPKPPTPKVAKSAPPSAPKSAKSASSSAPKSAKSASSSAPKAAKSTPPLAPKSAKSASPSAPKATKSAPSPAPKAAKSAPPPAPKAVKSA